MAELQTAPALAPTTHQTMGDGAVEILCYGMQTGNWQLSRFLTENPLMDWKWPWGKDSVLDQQANHLLEELKEREVTDLFLVRPRQFNAKLENPTDFSSLERTGWGHRFFGNGIRVHAWPEVEGTFISPQQWPPLARTRQCGGYNYVPLR